MLSTTHFWLFCGEEAVFAPKDIGNPSPYILHSMCSLWREALFLKKLQSRHAACYLAIECESNGYDFKSQITWNYQTGINNILSFSMAS